LWNIYGYIIDFILKFQQKVNRKSTESP